MKPLLVLLVAALAGAWIAWRAPAPDYVPPVEAPVAFAPAQVALPRAPAAGEVALELEVDGMCCRNCTGKLQAAATGLPGVRAFAVADDLLTARVLADASVEPAAVERALTFDKYTAKLRP
jgi:copper chaperone CopZ